LLVVAERAPAAKATRALSVCSLDGEGLGKVVGRGDSQNLQQSKKRGVPGLHGKHAAEELLSPDLRCFYTHHAEDHISLKEYLRTNALIDMKLFTL